MIELLAKQSGDQLLLAKLPVPPKTMNEVSGGVLKQLQGNAPNADLLGTK